MIWDYQDTQSLFKTRHWGEANCGSIPIKVEKGAMTMEDAGISPQVVCGQRPDRGSLWRDAILGCLVGLVGWYALGYHHVLPPGRIDWLLGPTNDSYFLRSRHVLPGLALFSPFAPGTFPLGLNPNYGMEYAGSIPFSDSIPVLAFIFKPFSRWLGRDFQYLGIWILVCFTLQGMFAALLASRFCGGRIARLLIAAFFVLSPIVLEESWTEYPLIGHWLLLWALYLYFSDPPRSIRWVWILLPVLGVMTTFYLVPMVLLVWSADAFGRIFRRSLSMILLIAEGRHALPAPCCLPCG